MKRVILALIIVFILLSISVLSLLDMKVSLNKIAAETASVRAQALNLSSEELQLRCRKLQETWNTMEKRFLLYVRHDHLDSIMEHLTELSAFSEEMEYAELLSNLDAAEQMMEHLWESVKPSYRTLL